MTILVTGGAGYIGSQVVLALLDAGERPVVLDDLSTGRRAAVPQGVPFVCGDTGDRPLVEAVIRGHGVEAVMHFAASVVVPDSVRDPLGYYRNNTANSRALLEAVVATGVRKLIFSSTAAVYGNPERVPVDEEAPARPVSPYGASKHMTEIMLRDVSAAHDLDYVVLRYFNVAGADPQLRTGQAAEDATHLIQVAVLAALGLRSGIEVYGTDYPTADGTCIRDYIHVADLADAHLAALQYLRRGGASIVLNCGYGRGFSVLEVLATVRRIAGVDFPIVHAARRLGDPAQIVAASERIRDVLDWRPRFDDLATIVGHALGWRRKQAAQARRNG